MSDVLIISAVRTPIGSYLGAFRDIAAYDLGALVLNEVVKRAGIEPAMIGTVCCPANHPLLRAALTALPGALQNRIIDVSPWIGSAESAGSLFSLVYALHESEVEKNRGNKYILSVFASPQGAFSVVIVQNFSPIRETAL